MTSKKESASESALAVPPIEELKMATEKDGNIIYNFCFSKFSILMKLSNNTVENQLIWGFLKLVRENHYSKNCP
jgi:hypothetical protein